MNQVICNYFGLNMQFKNYIILFSILWLSTALSAQTRIMVLPYEDIMLLSDHTDEIAEASGLTPFEAKSKLRYGLCDAASEAASESISVFTLTGHADSIAQRTEQKVYQCLSRRYTALPLHSLIISLNPDDATLPDSLQSGSNYLDGSTNYLEATIEDSSLVTYLNAFYGYEYYVLLNQVDILSLPGFFANSPEEKWIKVHYTIIDRNGKSIVGGMLRGRFKETTKTVDQILADIGPTLFARLWENFK